LLRLSRRSCRRSLPSWRQSRRSPSTSGTAGLGAGAIAGLRGAADFFTTVEWRAFLAGVRNGEFDDLACGGWRKSSLRLSNGSCVEKPISGRGFLALFFLLALEGA
jgi:hypothetical protein